MTKKQGFYKQYRENDSLLFSLNHWEFKLYHLIKSGAIFKEEYQLGKITLKKNQWLRSYKKLQEDLTMNVNKQKVTPTLSELRNAIKNLQRQGIIDNYGSNYGIVFTLLEPLGDKDLEENLEVTTTGTTTDLNTELRQQKKNVGFKKNELKKNVLKDNTTTTKKIENTILEGIKIFTSRGLL